MASRQYELIYILPPETAEQQATELHDQVAQIVERMHGQIEKTENWGRRKLAYEINDLTDGDYTLINFHADPTQIAELDRVLRITDAVVRHMIVRRDDQE